MKFFHRNNQLIVQSINLNVIAAVLISAATMFAQSGSLTGYVYDQNGKPLPGANVVITGKNTGGAADEYGFFEIDNLSYGTYTLEVSSIGFEKKTVENILFNENYSPLEIYLEEQPVVTEQVVISAGKYEQNIDDLTVSTSVIPPEIIEQRNFTKLDDVLRYVPGVSMTHDQLSIRGSSGYSRGAGTRVLVAIDGVPIYTGDTGEIIWEFVPLTDIEQIEVIKGPASSLYGSTAIGGVVNIVTKKPSKTPLIHFSSHGGFYDDPSVEQWKWNNNVRTYYGTSLTYSNTIGKLGYTASAKRVNNDSYREQDYNKRTLAYLNLSYEFDENASLSIMGNYLGMNRGQFNYWKNSRNTLVPSDDERDQVVLSDRFFVSAQYKQKFNNRFTLQVKPSYFYSFFEGRGVEITTSDADLFRNEIITNYSLSKNLMITGGTEQTYSQVTSNLFASPKFFTTSAYLQTEYKGIKNFVATLGLRYDYIKIDSVDGANAVTPRAGFNYKVSPNLIFRGSIGTGFRAPTPAEIFTTISVGGVDIKENTDLTYETSLSFELGGTYKPVDNISFDAAFFQTDYEDFIEPNFISDEGGLAIMFINLPKARIQGFEFVGDWEIFPGLLKIQSGYTYLWARDLELEKPMKYRPRHRVNTSINFTPYPFEFAAYYRYWSKYEAIDETIVQPPVNLIKEGDNHVEVYVWDLSAGYNLQLYDVPVKFSLNVYNVFNYNYVEFLGNISPIRNFSLRFDAYF